MEKFVSNGGEFHTRILPVDASALCESEFPDPRINGLDDWRLSVREDTSDASHLSEAVRLIQTTDVPVAFPTETVYGLGADATRSEAVRGIYRAKERPSDNPLIVHICSLNQLRSLLRPKARDAPQEGEAHDGISHSCYEEGDAEFSHHDQGPIKDPEDPIPAIYRRLIKALWPGPLTIILPNPPGSVLAPEVTSGLNTFGARMPDNALALALIKLAGVPLAAPSANASTKPSPTTAEHVRDDLDGRIQVILDGGPCSVGVESTVVDGLSSPPCILRPGGVSIEQLRQFPGWEKVVIAYRDQPQLDLKPKAPGMKYRHYSPRAKVVLYEYDAAPPSAEDLKNHLIHGHAVGVIRTKTWQVQAISNLTSDSLEAAMEDINGRSSTSEARSSRSKFLITKRSSNERRNSSPSASNSPSKPNQQEIHTATSRSNCKPHMVPPRATQLNPAGIPETQDNCNAPMIWDLDLGPSTQEIARGIFSALRNLDRKSVAVILVEGIPDTEGDLAAAVMNRVRKAASVVHGGVG